MSEVQDNNTPVEEETSKETTSTLEQVEGEEEEEEERKEQNEQSDDAGEGGEEGEEEEEEDVVMSPRELVSPRETGSDSDDEVPVRSKPPTRLPPPTPMKSFDTPGIFQTGFKSDRKWDEWTEEDLPDVEETGQVADVDLSGTEVASKYDIGPLLARGPFSIVKQAKSGEEALVLKVVNQETAPDIPQDVIKQEGKVLSAAGAHENLVSLKGIHETEKGLVLALERLDGQLATTLLANDGDYTEGDARTICKQWLSGLAKLHENNIVHRDLVVENVLHAGKVVKLAGFSLARICEGDQIDNDGVIGTQCTVAPELVSNQPYNVSADAWQAGVLIYQFVSGSLPFQDANPLRLTMSIRKGAFEFPQDDWSQASDAVKDLIQKLIVTDPTKRLTIKEALAHPWFSSTEANVLPNFKKNLKESLALD